MANSKLHMHKQLASMLIVLFMLISMITVTTNTAYAAFRNYSEIISLASNINQVAPHVVYNRETGAKSYGGCASIGCSQNPHKNFYSSYWEFWSQGASRYLRMAPGCRIVAQAKLLVEAGIASSNVNEFNPDVYFEYLDSHTSPQGKPYFISKYSIGETYGKPDKTAWGMVDYSNDTSVNKSPFRLVRSDPIKITSKDQAISDINNLLNDPNHEYYVMLGCDAHYAYVGRAASITAEEPIILNSSSTYSVSSNSIVKYREYESTNFDWIVCFERISTCEHEKYYNNVGVCTKCGYEYPFDNSLNAASSAGTYEVTASSIDVYSKPYASCGLLCMTKGAKFEIKGSVKNHLGEVYYKTSNGYIKGTLGVKLINNDSKLKVNPCPSITLNKGGYCPLTGSVSSNLNIKWIKASLDGKQYAYFEPNSSFVNLSRSPADDLLVGRSLSVGSHIVTIQASDGVKTLSANVNITVNSNQTVAAPTISVSDVEGGKQITITQNTSGATLYYYYYECGSSNRSTTNQSVSFKIDRNATVAAYSVKNGIMGERIERTYSVFQLNHPNIEVQSGPDGANIIITRVASDNAEIYYSTDGKNYSRYYGTVKLTSNCTVYAYAKKNGYITSDVSSANVNIQPPNTPAASLFNTENKVPQGDTASVSWGADDRASSYTIRLYKDGEVVETKTTSGLYTAFVLPDAGEYSITVQAHNAIGDSTESAAVRVTSMAPVTVTFVDYDDAVISTQQVKYGGNATRPTAPSRKGYTFDGWSRSYENVKADTTIKAEYAINTYTVKFYDTDGTRMLDSQYVVFGSPADITGPSANVSLPDGYCLAGWRIEDADEASDMDYTKVDSNMTLVAVAKWQRETLPIVITNVNAVWSSEATGYDVTATLNVADNEILMSNTKVVKIIAAAKSSEDKLLGIEVVTLNVESSAIGGSHSLFIACSESALADRIEVNILGAADNGRTGTVLAAQKSATPTLSSQGNYWSEWSETKPNMSEDQIQTKTQYRFRDNTKSYTSTVTGSSSQPSMSGWNYDGYTTAWGPTVYNGTSYIASSSTRKVWTEQELVQNGYTQYNYYGYRRTALDSNGHRWYHYCLTAAKAAHGGTWELIQTGWLNSRLTPASTRSGAHTAGHSSSCACTITGNVYKYSYNSRIYYWEATRTVDPVYRYHYYYQDLQYTHNFYKWTNGNWSDWSDTVYTAVPGSRDVETRTLYRYYTNSGAEENTSGEYRSIGGMLDSGLGNLSGQVATIMVYKELNTDPTQAQMEYVGQVTIGEGNTYSTTFKTKDEPSEETGNFIVSIALEGTTNLLNVDTINAPESECTVRFIGADGEELKVEQVIKGEDASAPEAPQLEGYRFIRWSGNTSNIQRNVDIVAEYEPETYAVAFVDWNNQTISLMACRHGDTLTAPAAPECVGYTFKYWDVFENTDGIEVTESMVVSAVYEPDTFTVVFYDYEGKPLSNQSVAYGQSADLPELAAPNNMVFLGWSTDVEWWKVTTDLEVHPILVYDQTAVVPVSSLGNEYSGTDAILELTAEEGATIYYTTDGSDPSIEGVKYEGPIELTETTVIQAVAIEPGKNTSDIIEVYFEQTEEFYYDSTPELVKLGEYNVVAQPGQEIKLRVSIEDNPGMLGYLFAVETDTSVFYMDYDIESGFDCIAGEASGTGTMICAPYNNQGWQILWYNADEVFDSGTLFTMTLKVSEEAQAGTYPVTVYYSPSNTISGEYFEETDISNAVISIESDSSVLMGDVNFDGQITTSDVILTARYIVGLVNISEQQQILADVNGDTKITNADVILLARYLLGLATLG